MTLDEGRAADIFAGQADRRALHEEGPECEELRESPVDGAGSIGHVAAPFAQLREFRMGRETAGEGGVRISDPADEVL